MRRPACALAAVIAIAGIAGTGAAGSQAAEQPSAAVTRAFAAFLNVSAADDVGAATDAILKSGVAFDTAYALLKQGRTYSKNVPKGVVHGSRREYGQPYHYSFQVPANYDPKRRYPARIHLHGGVDMREVGGRVGDGSIGTLAGDEPRIYIMPTAWSRSRWWSEDQVANLRITLSIAKHSYNIDENRVTLSGVSDGGTGAYYVAMRDTTPYASFLPLIGAIRVLGNPALKVDDLYPNNLRAKPFFIVNNGRDPLYPAESITPIVEHFKEGGVPVTYLAQPEGGHDLRFWPGVKAAFERFERERPRNPHPDALTLQCGEHHGFCRAHWLMIDRLTKAAEPGMLPDLNVMAEPMKTLLPPRNARRSGRVDVVRRGNTVEATTSGVSAFVLLLSPDAFDFAQPITVVTNGKTSISRRVEKSLQTLLTWAARDEDRTMLYGAELRVRVD